LASSQETFENTCLKKNFYGKKWHDRNNQKNTKMVVVLIQKSIDKNAHCTNLQVEKRCQKGPKKLQNEQIEHFPLKAIKTTHVQLLCNFSITTPMMSHC
jgi:hypothetical protein